MVIDSSALLAILQEEPEAADFARIMALSGVLNISAATLVEASVVCLRRSDVAEAGLRRLIYGFGMQVVAFDAVQADIARAAYSRYGKGRHPARLNVGDTFSYALAMHLSESLLFKGDDFAHTDVTPAV